MAQYKTMGLSIKSKLLIYSLCISLIPITIITLVYFLNEKRAIKEQTIEWLTAVAESKKLHVVSAIEAKKMRAIDFSSDGLIKNSLERMHHNNAYSHNMLIHLNKHLSTQKRILDPHIAAIALLNEKGAIIASTNKILIGKNRSEFSIFTNTKIMESAGVLGPCKIPFVGINGIIISAPVISKNNLNEIGSLLVFYHLSFLDEIMLDRKGFGETGEVYLLNGEGMMITSSRYINDVPFNLKMNTVPVHNFLANNKGTSGIYPDYRGVAVVGTSQYLHEYDLLLLAEIDKAEVFVPIKIFGIVALIASFLCASIVICAVIIFSFSTSQPIMRLKYAMERFMAGDLKYRIKMPRKDEIGVLSDSFNCMADKLALETHKLTCAVEQNPCAIIITDIDGSIVYVNPKFTEITGYSQKEAVGQNPRILKTETAPKELYKELWEKISSGMEWRGEFCNKRKNGTNYWISATISPVKDSDGKISNFIGIQEDITKAKQAESELREAVLERDKNISELNHLILFSTMMRDETKEDMLVKNMGYTIKEHFGANSLHILLLNENKNILEEPITISSIKKNSLFIKEDVILNPALCRTIRTGQKLVAQNIDNHISCECIKELNENFGYVCVPLIAGGKALGVIVLTRERGSFWSEKQIALISTYANITASSLYKIRLMNSAEKAAITDGLTGIYNRRFFEEMTKKQLLIAKRRNLNLSLFLIDIDYFKKVNDTYGHTAGDALLQELGVLLTKSIRESDFVARYGGEEFTVVLPEVEINEAFKKAEHIKTSVETSNFDTLVSGKTVRITLSIGVATFPLHGSNYEELVCAADRALYQAKEKGRNMVISA